MKIVAPGHIHKPESGWWDGQRLHCYKCNMTAQLEKGDKALSFDDSSATFACPTRGCGETILVTRPYPGMRAVMLPSYARAK